MDPAEFDAGNAGGTGNLSARTPRLPVQALSRSEYVAAQRQKEHAAKLRHIQVLRAADEQVIKERSLRLKQIRDEHCEALVEGIHAQEGLRREADAVLLREAQKQATLRQDLYDRWDAEVSQRVEYQLQRFMASEPPPCPSGFKKRPDLVAGDDPLKATLREQAAEAKFHKAATAVLTPRPDLRAMTPRERLRLEKHGEAKAQRGRSRPVLPIELWEQRQHYASQFGYFAQGYERGPGGFHTSRRMGIDVHGIDESDGVPAAGKSYLRTRAGVERNRLGMLEGTLAKEGESARYKRDHGASSGAPCQDHYGYERGNAIVDAEFPTGRKAFHKAIDLWNP